MGLLDLVFPDRCIACGKEGPPLCRSCRAGLAAVPEPLCERCGAPTAWPVARCRECAGRRLAFARARAAVVYEGPAAALVRAWKDGGQRRLAAAAADLAAAALPRPEASAVVFVPAARDRELWRGQHAAAALAAELARRWELPLLSALGRTGAPPPQRGLALAQRRRSPAGTFVALRPCPARVCLVDDVYTTGATASAAASALRRAGARRVEVATFARALLGSGRGARKPRPPPPARPVSPRPAAARLLGFATTRRRPAPGRATGQMPFACRPRDRPPPSASDLSVVGAALLQPAGVGVRAVS